MDLPFPNSSQQQTPSTTQVSSVPSSSQSGERNWLRLGVAAVVVIAVIAGLVFGIKAIYDANHHASNTASTQHSNGSEKPGSQAQSGSSTTGGTTQNGSQSGSSSASGTSATGSNGSGSQPSDSTATASSGAASGASLTNTGPGKTVAVFAGASFSGAVLYQVVLRRHLQKR